MNLKLPCSWENLLKANGFNVSYPLFRKNRLNLIAEKGLLPQRLPIVLSGHFDTVPLGKKTWNVDPFAGEISDGRIWGRGSSDMKGGLAAMVMASIDCIRGGCSLCGDQDHFYRS